MCCLVSDEPATPYIAPAGSSHSRLSPSHEETPTHEH